MNPRPPEKWPGNWWFTRSPGYFRFMIREFTSFVVAGYLVFLLVFLYRIGQGPQAYASLMEMLRSPLSVVLHLLVFAAACFHAVTWFNLTPSIMPVRTGEERVPDALLAIGAGYLPWAVVSVVVAWALLR